MDFFWKGGFSFHIGVKEEMKVKVEGKSMKMSLSKGFFLCSVTTDRLDYV